ncbi:UNVERIFIED_CONTAM: hypothetical protein GTU68_040480 [Idotea baltica]|nr:hypothetical protein [Idotea baltica]
MLALPGSFPHYLGVLEAMHYGSAFIFLAKFAIAFPFVFHVANGFRHLAWDLGYGFALKSLYKSGYLVLGSSLALSAAISCL